MTIDIQKIRADFPALALTVHGKPLTFLDTAASAQKPKQVLDAMRYCYENEYAYPLNTIGKPELMKKLLSFCEKEGVYGLGRWGEHSHYNSDLVVEKAMELADRL